MPCIVCVWVSRRRGVLQLYDTCMLQRLEEGYALATLSTSETGLVCSLHIWNLRSMVTACLRVLLRVLRHAFRDCFSFWCACMLV